MLGFNTNSNNMYINQNYGYAQNVSNPYQQQPAFDANFMMLSMINSILPVMLGAIGNQQSIQRPPVVPQPPIVQPPQENNSNSFLQKIIMMLLKALLSGRKPQPKPEPPAPVVPEKAFIVTSYKNSYFGDYNYHLDQEGESSDGVEVNLGRTIQDFSEQASGNGNHWDYRAHNYNKDNDSELQTVLSKLSASDKNLTFDKGQAYIISESGKILGIIANNQVNQTQTNIVSAGADSSLNDSSFKILSDLGVTQTYDFRRENINNEEGQGGQIEYKGVKYDIVSTVVRKETPLTFDLNGDGVKTSDKLIQYDINGDGKLDTINDVADGTLSIRGGKDGKDLFGNNTDLDGDGKADGFKNGFEALKALASKEGLINGKDDMKLDAADLKVLEDKYQFGMKTEGYNSKEKSLAEVGITEINLGTTEEVQEKANFDGRNNDVLTQAGATFEINGKEREYADVLHAVK